MFKWIKSKLDSLTIIDGIAILVVAQFVFSMQMEKIKMEMVKEYVSTETRVDSFTIVNIGKLRKDIDSLKSVILLNSKGDIK